MRINGSNYGNGNSAKPLASYMGRVEKIEEGKVTVRLKDLTGLGRNVDLALAEIESKVPIQRGDTICVEVLRANGNDNGSKVRKLGEFVVEKKYIVYQN